MSLTMVCHVTNAWPVRRLFFALDGDRDTRGVALFGVCTAMTQIFSAITHIWPDDHYLVRFKALLQSWLPMLLCI